MLVRGDALEHHETTLQRFIYGKPVNENREAGEFDILAITEGTSAEDAVLWRSLAVLEPLPVTDGVASQMMGVFSALESNLILARAWNRQAASDSPVYQYVLLPVETMKALAGDLQMLVEATGEIPQDVYSGHRDVLPPLELPDSVTWVADRRTMLYERLLHEGGSAAMERLFTLLDAVIDERRLLVRGAAGDLQSRLDLVQGVMLLIPPPLRSEITFSTYSPQPDKARARFVFADTDATSERWVVDLADDAGGDVPESSYGALLRSMWHGDLKAFIAELRALELMAATRLSGEGLAEGLALVAERQTLDMQVIAGGDVPVDQVIDVLENAPPEQGPLRTHYIRRLLEYALESRDKEVADAVAAYMDEDEKVDAVLNGVLEERLKEEPDSVYSFVRARLSQGVEESRWLPRLRNAAAISMQVAIADGDNETLMNWLRLLAREPAAYRLRDVLNTGIESALSRAYDDGEFASLLLTFCMRRATEFVDDLLADDKLRAALAAPIGPALREYDPQAVLTVLELGREFALVLLSRAAADAPENRAAARVFTPQAVESLWSMYTDDLKTALPDHYRPATILQTLAATGPDWLSTPALETLAGHVILEGDLSLVVALAESLAGTGKLFPLLPQTLATGTGSPDDVIRILGELVTREIIMPQQAVDAYFAISEAWQWEERSLPLIEKAARMLQKSPGLTVTEATLWRMIDAAAGEKVELIARVTSRRLLSMIAELDDDVELTHRLRRLHEKLSWSSTARGSVLNWWREYVRGQSLARLQQLDRALEGKRLLDDAQSVVQTMLAVRKMMGGRDLREFADAIKITFAVLEDLSDSFDPIKDRAALDFDQVTVRAELDTQVDELDVDERSVLAKNLKELAQMIIHMAEQRSKATLIRREGNIERQLLSGEQEPHSAVDTMKWLSGYLSGLQDEGDEEE